MMLFGVLPCLLSGYLIGYRGKHNLIAGFDSSKVNDAETLDKRIAHVLFVTGGLCFLLYLDVDYNNGVSISGWSILVLLMVVPIYGAFRAVSLDKKHI